MYRLQRQIATKLEIHNSSYFSLHTYIVVSIITHNSLPYINYASIFPLYVFSV